jgi:hypothetical protein
MKTIANDKILEEYGNYTELLPDELKIFGKDKSYRRNPTINKVDVSIIK